jgi:hypothetical protein
VALLTVLTKMLPGHNGQRRKIGCGYITITISSYLTLLPSLFNSFKEVLAIEIRKETTVG